jgi:hypothetical protein
MGAYMTISGLCPFEELSKLIQTSVNP